MHSACSFSSARLLPPVRVWTSKRCSSGSPSTTFVPPPSASIPVVSPLTCPSCPSRSLRGSHRVVVVLFHRVALCVEDDEAFQCWRGEAAQGGRQGHAQLRRGNRGEPTDRVRELQRLEIRQLLRPPLKIDRIRNYETTHALDDVVFTVDDLKRMEYLQAAISKSMQLYPSVPIEFKEALEDNVFPDGTVVKKGARVIYSIYSMARMESISGKDCREFRPERRIKDGVSVTESQFKYSVFNAEPRLCIGKKFVYAKRQDDLSTCASHMDKSK
ncbi:Cytochrome P450 [Canna indica]|uniref:Cytochrome P450 n=1 Tax=Canna indica TaxID=4628 RepID=A0AAQ3KR22_9LILI|nr:Cytochrome P450 [Canna indica]